MVLVLIISSILLFANYLLSSPDFLIEQVEKSNTFDSVYQSLIEKYENESNATAIPSEVYTSVISKEWITIAVKNYIFYLYEPSEQKNKSDMIDFTEIEKSITAYFEKYADENNVVKDNVYEQKLSDVISKTKKDIIYTVDVYRSEVLRESDLINKIFYFRTYVEKFLVVSIVAILILIIILILLKNPLYWIGTSLFSSGLLLAVPTAYLSITSYVMNFSIKDYVIFNLVTETLSTTIYIFLNTGIILSLIGAIMIVLRLIIEKRNLTQEHK